MQSLQKVKGYLHQPLLGSVGLGNSLAIVSKDQIIRLRLENIVYLKADQKYVVAHCLDGDRLLTQSLAQLEEDFPNGLLRIHRNCLVNPLFIRVLVKMSASECIERGGRWILTLRHSDKHLPFSRRQLSVIKKRIKS